MPIIAITNFTGAASAVALSSSSIAVSDASSLSSTSSALSSASNAFSSATAASRFTIRWCDGAQGLH